MNLKALLCAALVLSCGCARSKPSRTALTASSAASRTEAPPESTQAQAQRPGDYVVYRFSGAFRKAPLTLTQRVLEASGARTRVELAFDDGKTKRVVRARYDRTPGAARELVDAARVAPDGAEHPMKSEELDLLMAETALAVDANEGAIGTERVTIVVAGRPIACEKTTFRVTVGKRKAVMSALKSDAFAWGDVGGEIKTDDGKLLYRAEVIDAGSSPLKKPGASSAS
jgi:hypothetical protein